MIKEKFHYSQAQPTYVQVWLTLAGWAPHSTPSHTTSTVYSVRNRFCCGFGFFSSVAMNKVPQAISKKRANEWSHSNGRP